MSISLYDEVKPQEAFMPVPSTPDEPILRLSNVSIALVDKRSHIQKKLVHDMTMSIRPGEMLGLAGESGSGKSLTASAILGLLEKPLQVTSGQVELGGVNVLSLSEREKRNVRGKRIAYISQNYQGSFTPFFKIGKQLIEAIRSHESIPVKQAEEIALTWLERVKLPAERVYGSYPFQLSGGQLQRVSLAAALMMEPELIIADEPTTALDVLTGEQVLDLFQQLQQETGCAVLLISHNLTHLLKRTDRMAVMYGGRIVEVGPTESIRNHARHPYTQLLLQARPKLSARIADRLTTIPGEAGAAASTGCPFSLRCPFYIDSCGSMPVMQRIGQNHTAACHMIRKGDIQHEAAIAD